MMAVYIRLSYYEGEGGGEEGERESNDPCLKRSFLLPTIYTSRALWKRDLFH